MTDAPEWIWAVYRETKGSVMIGEWSDTIRHLGGTEYIRADLCRPEPQGWQPIETAPRDGMLMLLRQPYGDDWSGTFVGFWSKPRECFMYASDRPIAGLSHWMPLPEPPKP